MSMYKDKDIENCIYDAMDEVNMLLPIDNKMERSLDIILFGKGSKLDSLNIINFIVALEGSVETKFNVENFSLMNDLISEDDVNFFSNGLGLLEFIKSKIKA